MFSVFNISIDSIDDTVKEARSFVVFFYSIAKMLLVLGGYCPPLDPSTPCSRAALSNTRSSKVSPVYQFRFENFIFAHINKLFYSQN